MGNAAPILFECEYESTLRVLIDKSARDFAEGHIVRLAHGFLSPPCESITLKSGIYSVHCERLQTGRHFGTANFSFGRSERDQAANAWQGRVSVTPEVRLDRPLRRDHFNLPKDGVWPTGRIRLSSLDGARPVSNARVAAKSTDAPTGLMQIFHQLFRWHLPHALFRWITRCTTGS